MRRFFFSPSSLVLLLEPSNLAPTPTPCLHPAARIPHPASRMRHVTAIFARLSRPSTKQDPPAQRQQHQQQQRQRRRRQEHNQTVTHIYTHSTDTSTSADQGLHTLVSLLFVLGSHRRHRPGLVVSLVSRGQQQQGTWYRPQVPKDAKR